MQPSFHIKPIISLIIIFITVFALVAIVGPVLTPFIIALILAYILNPLTEKIHKNLKIHRSIVSFIIAVLVFLVFLTIPFLLIPTIAMQLKIIIARIPDLINLFNNNVLEIINNRYDTDLNIDFDNLKNTLLNNVGTVYSHINLFSPLAKNSFIVIEIIVCIVLIPFVLFYALSNWHKLLAFFDSLIPENYTDRIHAVFKDIDIMLSAYLRGQVIVMLVMACYYGIALHLTGLLSGAIIGIITGLLVFIPYLGILTGLVMALTMSFAGFYGMHQIIAILVVFGIGHLLEGGIVTPFLVGSKLGLNPVMIILALIIFGKAFGVVGVLLALPLAAISVVLFKYAKAYYLNSTYYHDGAP